MISANMPTPPKTNKKKIKTDKCSGLQTEVSRVRAGTAVHGVADRDASALYLTGEGRTLKTSSFNVIASIGAPARSEPPGVTSLLAKNDAKFQQKKKKKDTRPRPDQAGRQKQSSSRGTKGNNLIISDRSGNSSTCNSGTKVKRTGPRECGRVPAGAPAALWSV